MSVWERQRKMMGSVQRVGDNLEIGLLVEEPISGSFSPWRKGCSSDDMSVHKLQRTFVLPRISLGVGSGIPALIHRYPHTIKSTSAHTQSITQTQRIISLFAYRRANDGEEKGGTRLLLRMRPDLAATAGILGALCWLLALWNLLLQLCKETGGWRGEMRVIDYTNNIFF